jgi:dCTP deaminase
MAFLPHQKIKERQSEIFPKGDFVEENLGPAAYDLCLGDEVFVSSEQQPMLLEKGDFVKISPGEFALLMTYEYISVPRDMMAFLSVRFRYKLLGLINVSGFHVDPGFQGKLLYTVYNAGPNDIILKYKEPIFMIFFAQLDEEVQEGYLGKFKEQVSLPIETVIGLRGASTSLTSMSHRIDQLETSLKIYGAIIGGLFLALVGAILRNMLSSP